MRSPQSQPWLAIRARKIIFVLIKNIIIYTLIFVNLTVSFSFSCTFTLYQSSFTTCLTSLLYLSSAKKTPLLCVMQYKKNMSFGSISIYYHVSVVIQVYIIFAFDYSPANSSFRDVIFLCKCIYTCRS